MKETKGDGFLKGRAAKVRKNTKSKDESLNILKILKNAESNFGNKDSRLYFDSLKQANEFTDAWNAYKEVRKLERKEEKKLEKEMKINKSKSKKG